MERAILEERHTVQTATPTSTLVMTVYSSFHSPDNDKFQITALKHSSSTTALIFPNCICIQLNIQDIVITLKK
jgi:hypothetical protein